MTDAQIEAMACESVNSAFTTMQKIANEHGFTTYEEYEAYCEEKDMEDIDALIEDLF